MGVGALFTQSVRVGYSFPACHGGSAKYLTCLVFQEPSTTQYWTVALPTWKPSCHGSLQLVGYTSCLVLYSYCLEKLAVLSWLSTRTPSLDRPSTQNNRT